MILLVVKPDAYMFPSGDWEGLELLGILVVISRGGLLVVVVVVAVGIAEELCIYKIAMLVEIGLTW